MPGNDELLEKLDMIERRGKEKSNSVKMTAKAAADYERKYWERRENIQRFTFEKVIKKRHKHLLPEWKDLFAEFFILLRDYKVKSINEFLYNDSSEHWNNSNLKVGLINE